MLPVGRGTIASRLFWIGALALLAVAALAAGTIYCAMATSRTAARLDAGGMASVIDAGALETLLEQHRWMVDKVSRAPSFEAVPSNRKALHQIQVRVEALTDRLDAEAASDIKPMLRTLWQAAEERARAATQGSLSGHARTESQYVKQIELVQEFARTYRRSRVDDVRSAVETIRFRANMAVEWAGVIGIMAILLIGPFAFALLSGTLRRLERVTLAMGQLARQDTNVDVGEIAAADEIGDMARAVSVFKQNAIKLRQLNRWLDIALNNMARGLSMFDADRCLVICNSVYAQLYDMPEALARPGTTFEAILEHRANLIASVDGQDVTHRGELMAALSKAIDSNQASQSLQRLKSGRIIEVSLKPLAWGGWVALHEDVTDRLLAAERMARLARQDPLTGMANRLHFREALEAEVAMLGSQSSFALLAIDLDDFKDVNDAVGHPGGDALLTIVGHRLKALARRGDIVARLGGDEFAILQRDVLDKADACALARRIVDVLCQPALVHGKRLEIGGTVGIVMAPQDGGTAEEIMRKADMALYRAKAAGKGVWRFYDREMEGRMRARRQLEVDLADAAERGELALYYQPIVSLASRRVEGCEALIRWRHPVRGMVPPAEFIPIAEESGLICEVGRWALAQACEDAARWPEALWVAVNLSVAQFAGPDLGGATAEALERSGLEPARLVLEVTETLLLGDDPETLEIMHRLHDLGVAIALDDFGTGYSSLSHLRSFPFDKIKIDQSFVRDLPQRKNCEAIVGAVARLASYLDMTTVAEGVETEEHLARVEAAGCDSVQGYFFSRPVPAGELADVVAEINERLASGDVRAA